jgi:hypothetical protein
MATPSLKLIVESDFRSTTAVKGIIKENESGEKNHFIEGIFIQTEAKNRNGRNYPKALMEQCVQKYKQERMNPEFGMRSFGELGHPDGVEINLDRVSHYVTELNWNGNDVIGKAKIINKTPIGRTVQTILEEGLRLGVSTRGLGALSKKPSADGSKLVEAYDMIAIDIVADPSAPKGFVDGILENKEYIIKDDGIIVECYEGLERALSSLPSKSDERQQLFMEQMEKFLQNLRTK